MQSKKGKIQVPRVGDMTKDDFEILMSEVESGDQEAIGRFRLIIEADPETWRPIGDLMEIVRS